MAPSQADAVETATKIIYDCWSREKFGPPHGREPAREVSRHSKNISSSPRNIACVLLALIVVTAVVLWLGNWWLALQ
jgi:hypothetical protein